MFGVCSSAEDVPERDFNLIILRNMRKHSVIQIEKLVAPPQKYKSVIKVVKGGTPSKQLASVQLHILFKCS